MMMSPFISRLSRLCLRKPPTLRNLGGVRFLSENHLYQIDSALPDVRDKDIGRVLVRIFGASKPSCQFLKRTVPMELMKENGTIGASHGWVATLKEGIICLHHDLNPSASDSEPPKRISLPPLETLPHCQTQLVTNVAMSSSSPDEDQDCIVAVKFVGPQLSLCRPAEKKPEWVNIKIEDEAFFFSSQVMYSKRDEMFSIPASGGTHRGSWDLEKHKRKPKLQAWRFQDIPEYELSAWAELDTCSTSEHLVESPHTGEVFMVRWFKQRNNDEGGTMEQRRIMVFKLDEEKENAWFITNMGDLSIFLSKSEPFCLKASSFNLLKNCIYFVDNNHTGIINLFGNDGDTSFRSFPAPYYIPPQS